jgi:hypothetical protein
MEVEMRADELRRSLGLLATLTARQREQLKLQLVAGGVGVR